MYAVQSFVWDLKKRVYIRKGKVKEVSLALRTEGGEFCGGL